MSLRLSMLAVLLVLAVASGWAQNVPASAVGQSLLQDLNQARAQTQANRSPWADPLGRPQPEPVALLLSELPGSRIWNAFKPVDQFAREALRAQRQGYIVKDAAIRERRSARSLLDDLSAAIRAERPSYSHRAMRTALLQVAQVDYALKHMEYYSSLCILWSMADVLGLWDRQAALEVAYAHLAELRERGAGRGQLRDHDARRMDRDLEAISQIITTALAWEPLPESIGPANSSPQDPGAVTAARHFADPADLGEAFEPWRDGAVVNPACGPMTYDETHAREAFSLLPRNTRCLTPCAQRYRDWQYALDDYRYGWVVDTHTAANPPWDVNCDWRRLEPGAAWPGAKGAQDAGGL